MSASFQFTIKHVEQKVRQQGRQRAALRRSFRRFMQAIPIKDTCFQKMPDQPHYSGIPNSLFHLAHQLVMIHPIKELFQINVHHPVVSRAQVFLCSGNRLMGVPAWSEAVASCRECPIPIPLKDLHHRLLDESVQHRRNAKLTHPA